MCNLLNYDIVTHDGQEYQLLEHPVKWDRITDTVFITAKAILASNMYDYLNGAEVAILRIVWSATSVSNSME